MDRRMDGILFFSGKKYKLKTLNKSGGFALHEDAISNRRKKSLMPTLRKSIQRDFIKQLIIVANNYVPQLAEEGVALDERIQDLKDNYDAAELAQAEQTDAFAAAKAASRKSSETLEEAYTRGSELVSLLTGFLGKNDTVIKELNRIRKQKH